MIINFYDGVRGQNESVSLNETVRPTIGFSLNGNTRTQRSHAHRARRSGVDGITQRANMISYDYVSTSRLSLMLDLFATT